MFREYQYLEVKYVLYLAVTLSDDKKILNYQKFYSSVKFTLLIFYLVTTYSHTVDYMENNIVFN